MENPKMLNPFTLRHKRGALRHAGTVGYAVLGYPGGLWLTTRGSYGAEALGLILATEALVIAAYLIHEFVHRSVFTSARTNTVLGEIMSWLVGSAYVSLDVLRKKHLHHHADKADVISFDYKTFLDHHPLFRSIVLGLEFLYIPAVEILMHFYVWIYPFSPQAPPPKWPARLRFFLVLLSRAAWFGALWVYSARACVLSVVAWLFMLTVLRFFDCFQHTYEAVSLGADQAAVPLARRTRDYEFMNTYTNVVSLSHPLLNLVILNFGYHNAHHIRPSAPWLELPDLHKKCVGDESRQVLGFLSLLRNYHKYRCDRVLSRSYGHVAEGNVPGREQQFIGAVGVSFLTAV